MFANLDICEQYAMLRCCWNDLFILIAAQYDLQIDSVALAYEIETCTSMWNERKLRLKQTLANFHEYMLRLRGLEEAEYACLKVMVLFSSGEYTLAMFYTPSVSMNFYCQKYPNLNLKICPIVNIPNNKPSSKISR